MRLWLHTLLRVAAGTYFVLTSLYCLLAFLPYTYCAFIKAPPYAWMPVFTRHQAALYWLAVAAAAAANWPLRESWRKKSEPFLAGVGLLAAGGVYLSVHPFLHGLQNDRPAYWWSLAALLPVMGLPFWRPAAGPQGRSPQDPASEKTRGQLFGYSAGLLVALVVSAVYVFGARMRVYSESHAFSFHPQDVEIALWSLVSHLVLALAVLSALNLIFLLASKTTQPQRTRRGLLGGVIVIVLGIVLARFLDNAMSFDGIWAYVYAGALAAALTMWGFSLILPMQARRAAGQGLSTGSTITTWIAIGLLTALALASRRLIGGEDWNGFVASTWALFFWMAMSLCLYRLRPARANYSIAMIVAILLGSAFVYKGLQATEIFWGRPMGSTDDEISLTLEKYGDRDASFQLAHAVLGNSRSHSCGELCRVLREYTNIRDPHPVRGVRLVDNMTPTPEQRPNIFIFVVDSMRADYIGVYNPEHVHYTPNLDALARDGVAFRNVYTQYAGTTLSEPAVWTGALLLHAHLQQPFDEVNSLRTLAHTDDYQMVVSYDTMLAQMFSSSENLTKLDTEKELWNEYEACSTIEQLESTLDTRPDKTRPVFFFTQPMNVHQFARNSVPLPASQHWQSPAGLIARITYEVHWVDSCIGSFVGYLKQRGLYDNSIIVVTSDHGDATGEFGRTSHSLTIWPEIMRVPLIMHVAPKLRARLVYDENRLSTLTDIAPTLYYLLGHRPIRRNPLYGRPLFAETRQELESYHHDDFLLASDVRAVYGILTADGRYLYTTYDSPEQSYLFDLRQDPDAQHSILTPTLKRRYDEEIIQQLQMIGDYYGCKPGVGSLVASAQP